MKVAKKLIAKVNQNDTEKFRLIIDGSFTEVIRIYKAACNDFGKDIKFVNDDDITGWIFKDNISLTFHGKDN